MLHHTFVDEDGNKTDGEPYDVQLHMRLIKDDGDDDDDTIYISPPLVYGNDEIQDGILFDTYI